jgi:hypothetical protein
MQVGCPGAGRAQLVARRGGTARGSLSPISPVTVPAAAAALRPGPGQGYLSLRLSEPVHCCGISLRILVRPLLPPPGPGAADLARPGAGCEVLALAAGLLRFQVA